MCVLRAANPVSITQLRSTDPTFGARSVYLAGQRDPGDLSRRLAGYVVLAHDPQVPLIAADYWEHSLPFYRAVMDEIRMLVEPEPVAAAAYRRLAERPADAAAEAELRRVLARLLAERRDRAAACERVASAADDNVYIGYFRGDDYQAGAAPVTLGELREIACRQSRPSAGAEPEIAVVIPLMDRDGGARVRNLVACLLAVRDQTFGHRRVAVTVVEFDAIPRWRHVVEPLADHYVHVRGTGRFNKSWSYNVAVRRTAAGTRLLCLLDADILADREFLERNHARFADAGHDAHLPHTEVLSLDEPSTHRLIGQRCRSGDAPLAGARGLLLRDAPGGCLWVRTELFHKVGGFDERYSGWGGEDEDMLVRVAAAGTATQCDDVMLHTAHPRPPMRTSGGVPFNGHIPIGSWTGERGYGDPAGPVKSGSPEPDRRVRG